MTDLRTQLQSYAKQLDESQTPIEAREATEARRETALPRARTPRWAVAVAIVAIIGLSAGVAIWLASDEPAPGPQDTPTTVGESTTVPTTTLPPTTVPVPTAIVGTLPVDTYALIPAGPSGAARIHLLSPDGTVLDLTPERGEHLYPSWSPDGSTVVFEARRPVRYQIFTVGRDGSGLMQLTDDPTLHSFQAHWSPDGSQIVFVRSTQPYSAAEQEIWIMSADGSDQRLLAAGDSRGPVWFPDGQNVVYLHDGETFRVAVDGGEPVQLTDLDAAPISFSPDGRWLAVEASRDAAAGGFHDQASDIWLVPVGGGDPMQLTTAPGRDYQADWSPDGTRIVFTSTRGEREDVFVIGVDGSGLTQLTTEPGIDGAARWLANGQILFISDRDGDRALYLMDDDGSGQTRVWPEDLDWVVWFAGIDHRTG